MPMIHVYAAAGTFPDSHALAHDCRCEIPARQHECRHRDIRMRRARRSVVT
jgi:hypothetical protein